MTNHRSIVPLVFGFVASVLAHLAVIVPLLVAIMTASGWQSVRLEAAFDPEDFKARDQDDEVRLGIDARTPSSFTWIGYEEYQEHLAVLAEIEQAANSPMPLGQMSPRDLADALDQRESQLDERPPADADQQESPVDAAAARLAKLLELFEYPASPAKTTDDQPDTAVTDRTALQRALALLDELLKKALQQAHQAPPTNAEEPTAPRQSGEVEVANAPQPKPSRPTTPTSGNASEMESDPTSKLEVPLADIELGKPIAGHGLQIKPRRPSFTTLTMLTAAPGNPLVEIRFPRSGRPVLARILESSGDRRVDEAILNSLYRWRAQGKQLEALGEGESIPIRLRIVLVKPRSS
ncbi:MAG: hypothetical protein V3T84_09450 [Phycisphaerales bacterium]